MCKAVEILCLHLSRPIGPNINPVFSGNGLRAVVRRVADVPIARSSRIDNNIQSGCGSFAPQCSFCQW